MGCSDRECSNSIGYNQRHTKENTGKHPKGKSSQCPGNPFTLRLVKKSENLITDYSCADHGLNKRFISVLELGNKLVLYNLEDLRSSTSTHIKHGTQL